MLVGLERFDLRIVGSRSLKQKRHVIKPLCAAIRQRFPVSVAEVEHHDLWQRSTIAVACVGAEQHHVRRVLQRIERFVDEWAEVDVIDRELEVLWPDA